MMMEAFDVVFSGKSVYVSRRLMAIEPMTALRVLLVCELIHNAERRDLTFINFLHISFGHEMLTLVMVVISTGQ